MRQTIEQITDLFYSPVEEDGKRVVYLAVNKIDNKIYVGQTSKGMQRRKYEHFRSAKYGDTTYFHKALRKHGEDNFEWFIIDHCNSKEAKRKTGLKSKGRCHMKGAILSEETKQKISKSLKGKYQSKETREKRRLSLLGGKRSEETKKRTIIANKKAWEKRRTLCVC